MRYEVVLAPDAVRALRSLTANRRAEVRDALERHDVTSTAVEILAIVTKEEASGWLEEHGAP
ncbi:MAG TPA: hypothetical protein VFL90_09620 [Methylomirabilota bacterium]|nr:hypothetical protein [Methylomirabilota bacterium]